LSPWGHHLTNLLLHAATAILLFLVLREMTGDLWPSALVAAVFAIHPLRVESVAWVAERKDILSGLFFMLTVGAYLGYVRRPFSLPRYLLVVLPFGLGLMCKPMLVTLPLVLLLLDYWPLRRICSRHTPCAVRLSNIGPSAADMWRADGTKSVPATAEKVPLLAMTYASCVVTIWAQSRVIAGYQHITMPWRIGNALVSSVAYLIEFFCPMNLAVLYPHPGSQFAAVADRRGVGGVAAIFAIVVVFAATVSLLADGLAVVLGDARAGDRRGPGGQQAMADRYTYLPQIGLCIALAWGVKEITGRWQHRGWACSVASSLVVLVLMVCAWRQTIYCRTLRRCGPAAGGLHGEKLRGPLPIRRWLERSEAGRTSRSPQYEKALEIDPIMRMPATISAKTFAEGKLMQPAFQIPKALEIDPSLPNAHYQPCLTLTAQGQVGRALRSTRSAETKARLCGGHTNLGAAYLRQEKFAERLRLPKRPWNSTLGTRMYGNFGIAL